MKSYKVFLIISPGLEDLAAREITAKLPVEAMDVSKGGIELTTDLNWLVNAHLLLKIPTRILLRITEFKVRDFPKLYHKFANFQWKEYLSHPQPQWEISCSKSRLNHTGRIEETVKKALNEYLFKQPLNQDWKKKNYPPQTFYIRLVDDLLTLSLDLTGEPLYKRGLQTIKGEAPLRENLAAALVMDLFEGITKPMTLVDPMCGSGTFLTEVRTFNKPLHLRPFAIETAPFFKGHSVMVRNAPVVAPLNAQDAIGFDINQDLIEKVGPELLPYNISLRFKDSLLASLDIPDNSLMICNPPYGERIKIQGKRGSFLREAWEKFLMLDKPFRFGWLLPSDMDDLFSKPANYKLLSKRHFRNGGMAVTFWVWERLQPELALNENLRLHPHSTDIGNNR